MTLEKQKNRKINDSENVNVSVAKPTTKMCVFGTCLENLMKNSSTVAVPFVVSRLCCYIEKYGLLQQNLNEETGETTKVNYLKREFDESGDASLELRGNVSTAMKLLKLFLEELPEPLIPASMHSAFLSVKQNILGSNDCVQRLKSLVGHLPTSAFCVLKYLSHFLLHMAKYEQRNGLNPANLSVMFGPVIFRPDKKDPIQWIVIRNITHCFVVDYYAIFERNNALIENVVRRIVPDKKRQMAPVPSSIVPVPSMVPLSVEIPPVYSSYATKVKLNIQGFPILSVQNEKMDNDDVVLKHLKIAEENLSKETKLTSVPLARKRKENILATDLTSRSNVCRIPKSIHIRKNEIHNDKEHVNELENCHGQNSLKFYEAFHENGDHSLTNALVNEDCGGNHSPHPPDPKRRELEFFDSKKIHVDKKYRTHHRNFVKYYNDAKTSSSRRSCKLKRNVFEKTHSILSESPLQNDEYISLKTGSDEFKSDCSMLPKSINDYNNNAASDIYEITRPASCPVPDSEDDCTLETNQSTLSLSWSTLFEAEEPIISNRRYDWDVSKNSEEIEAVSPLVQHFRSSELDSSIAPSPPVEHFQKSPVKEDAFSTPIKKLMKKIRGLKKKLKRFDEKYETEYGYMPSHAEKTNYPEAKKLLNELHKARKELKELKDDYHLISVTNDIWQPTRDVHVLEDTTNCLKSIDQNGWDSLKKHFKPHIQKSWDDVLKCLEGDRKLANRPELIEDMTTDQVKDEKLAIQKTLLHFESIHGKPSKKEDRNTIRPLYERYRNIKRLLVKSNSFPVTSPKTTVCNSLEPIMEHETMDFRASVEEVKSEKHLPGMNCDFADAINQDINDIQPQSTCFQFLDNKYNNSNLHELPLPELIFQQHQARMEKRRIRKTLREFEAMFMKINGRKVQKEDKVPVESLYEEYKLVKARVRLLEALISKHHLEHASE